MKATTLTFIIATVLALQVNLLFAGNESISAPAANESAAMSLAPSTPNEATFDDMSTERSAPADLAPVTPAMADFEDAVDTISTDNVNLTPITPNEADFE